MSIRSNIPQRNHADITIYHVGGGSLSVPITPASTRRFMLMQEDFIQLSVSLAEPIHIAIGDYVIDEVFGRFVVTDEQMPRYNQRTGGYDYTLRLDAEYIGWKNWLFCLALDGKRTESRWNLTDRLDVHVQQIADNINIITDAQVTPQYNTDTGITTYISTGYGISITADNAADIKHLSYEGMDILSALNAIASEWSCEWWVTNDEVTVGDTTYAKTIHFGKCEDAIGISHESIEDGAYVMELGGNVESMDIARDQQDYCNRLYAYGGTQNIPEDYDRKLEFVASTTPRFSTFSDPDRALTIGMIDAEPTAQVVTMSLGTWSQGGTTAERTYTQRTNTVRLSGNYTFDIDLIAMFGISGDNFTAIDLPSVSLSAVLRYGDESRIVKVQDFRSGEIVDGMGWFANLRFSQELPLGSTAVDVYLQLVWRVTFPNDTHTNDSVSHSTSGTAQAVSSAASKVVQVVFNGTVTECTFNGATGLISPKPSGLVNGSKYTIANLILTNIPLSWYTTDYDAGTLATMGEKRLHLPLATYPNRYIDAEGNRTPQQIVERAVLFNDIYPKLTLRIKAGTLQGEEKQQRVEHEDKSVSYEDWTQWSFEVEMDKGDGTWGEFQFRDYYILDGNKLQAVFTAPQTAGANGHLLAGMTFDIGTSGERYIIIRNEDYGVLLPNKRLKPTELDTLVFTGFDPRYIKDLDMVSAAEHALAAKSDDYLDAVQEGQFTITNKMMSRSMMEYPFCSGSGYDESGRRLYGLLNAGTKVIVNHDALPGGSKTSRVLGYEYKLDMPYDTPTYVIGETEAFSRLKQLEKQITKLS